MVFIRYWLTVSAWLFAYVNTQAQTVYYPASASQLLQSTADDLAALLSRALPGNHFTVQSYESVPATGIILIYDETISGAAACKIKSNGTSYLSFAGGVDNGLVYGVYQYLHLAGFRFYQPGTVWEVIPPLNSPFTNIDTLLSYRYKYKGWFISGGCNRWAMDNNNAYQWDTYKGENGHQWALYQRRNNMTGAARFNGHRDDIMTPDYLAALQSNPCYVAPYDGSRVATRQSVADVNSVAAMQHWATAIEKRYTDYKNIIYASPTLYANQYRNFNFINNSIGIEVPDGSHWANSISTDCPGTQYLKASDQHFTLANFTAQNIIGKYPGKTFQVYAYDGHADIPSPSIQIHPAIDVQVVPTAFQSETSSKGLLNRWYSRSQHVSEYHYFNLPQWSGETPSSYRSAMKEVVERLQTKNAQGVVWESATSKFATLPFLYAANMALEYDTDFDVALQDFCNTLFENAATTVHQLLQCWGDDKVLTVYYWMGDNKYKLPYYFNLVKKAEAETKHSSENVKQRIRELKAFMLYMNLYYDWITDSRLPEHKKKKAEALCLYLAKINKLQIVNSYYLINTIASLYDAAGEIQGKYNIVSGTVYQNLPLITNQEIDENFTLTLAGLHIPASAYVFKEAEEIKNKFEQNELIPLEKINVKVLYTFGKDYSSRTEYNLIAEKPGSFSIIYTPYFEMPGKGYINFTVEADDKALNVLKDFSIYNQSKTGIINIQIPEAGRYKLSIVTKYKSSADLTIVTNGNYFYKEGAFVGGSAENYRADLISFPGYFYVPENAGKIFFSTNNSSNKGINYETAANIGRLFMFRDENGKALQPQLFSTTDSALFYIDIPAGSGGKFWQIQKTENVRMCFANISNVQWFARRKPCAAANFSITVKSSNRECITHLQASQPGALHWQILDAGTTYTYDGQSVDLPQNISSAAIITATNGNECLVSRRIADDEAFIRAKKICIGEKLPDEDNNGVMVFPNPGPGVFKCIQNGRTITADMIGICNEAGVKVANFSSTPQFNISAVPPGVYFYTITINKITYKGKLIKI